MKNARALGMIGISVVLGLGAVFMAWRMVENKTRVETNTVVVAARDLDLGTRLAADSIQAVQWPKGSTPDGAFATTDTLLKDPKSQEPRVIRASLQRGEPVLESKLAPLGTQGGLSAVIAQGKRAITVRVNDVVGVAGFALPGNFVDVVVNTQDDGVKSGDRDRSISKIVLERMLVLAVAQEAGRSDENKPKVVNAVTLEATPEQAEKLDLARSVGTLSLVLRNQVDPIAISTGGATKDSLLQLHPPKPPAPTVAPRFVAARMPEPAPQNCVDVISGTQSTRECF
jgi:pilus assembly protein CpaB